MMKYDNPHLSACLAPDSLAVVGASDHVDKVGGRPIHYLKQFGFKGRIYPVNPRREKIQGFPCYAGLSSLPEVPDLVLIIIGGQAAVETVGECADLGVKAVMIIASGFSETGEQGARMQAQIVQRAHAANMAVIGPNTQGLANFGNGTITSFSSAFLENAPKDGPVAIVSQSGATSAAIYGLLREQDIGVRYVLATGNEADVDVAELTMGVVADPKIRLVLLYMENIRNPQLLAQAARLARDNGVSILVVKAGRTEAGQAVAASHTAALANEDRVVDAFLRTHGIWRVNDPYELARLAPLYLRDWAVSGSRVVATSNSGASCVMIADMAGSHGLTLPKLTTNTADQIAEILPGFASASNPIDLTGALLSNSALFSNVLKVLESDPSFDALLFELPIAGQAYDIDLFAKSCQQFSARTRRPVMVSCWQQDIAKVFREHDILCLQNTAHCLQALAGLTQHQLLLKQIQAYETIPASVPASKRGERRASQAAKTNGPVRWLNEAQSLTLAKQAGIETVAFEVCRSLDQALSAFVKFGTPVALKICSADIPHKADDGFVMLDLRSEAKFKQAYGLLESRLRAISDRDLDVIVAPMRAGRRELMLGARMDPIFGLVVVVGDGGKHVEALGDVAVLVPPFDSDAVIRAMHGLHIGPILKGIRDEPALDLASFAKMACSLADFVGRSAERANPVVSVELNPIMVGCEGEGAWAVDGLVQLLSS